MTIVRALENPIDPGLLIKKKKTIRKELLGKGPFIKKKVAIMGGSTTDLFRHMLDIFLLKNGIECEFYESEYNQYFEEIVFDNEKLVQFNPDLIYIHTTQRNISMMPSLSCSKEQVEEIINNEVSRFCQIWTKATELFKCSIVQNNFDLPSERMFSNFEYRNHAAVGSYILAINQRLNFEASQRENLHIFDINYLANYYGLRNWNNHSEWFSYKYALNINLIPDYCYKLSTLFNTIWGKTKKCLILDLDNTLWGGVIGDDGLEGIQLDEGNPIGEAHRALQKYALGLKERGILLAVCSKNDLENAKEGFSHPGMILKLEDISCFKANWDPKPLNIEQIASELNIGLDSFVFLDDNPAERELVRSQLPMVSVPEVGSDIEHYVQILDQGSYFETLGVSKEDLKRAKMYQDNAKRTELSQSFENYDDFLQSLEMVADVDQFCDLHINRIFQLINKTNQFNLTLLRMELQEVIAFQQDKDKIGLYGKLKDKFGDNGLITVLIARLQDRTAIIENWLMSCRVLKRGMEQLMMDELIKVLNEKGIHKVTGIFRKGPKNKMVEEHYRILGFNLVDKNDEGSLWELDISTYKPVSKNIKLGTYE